MSPVSSSVGRLVFSLAAAMIGANICAGDLLRFTLDDQAGDPRDNFDVVSVQVTFDASNGDFRVKAKADPAHPFTGSHLLYLSVFNPDAGSIQPSVSLFSTTRFGLTTSTPTTMLERSGNAPVLKVWKAGNRVASYDAFGLPAGVSSLQSVLGGTRQGFSMSDEIRDTAIIEAVPEPAAAIPATVAAIAGVAYRSRRQVRR